jgi:hypothetical protein
VQNVIKKAWLPEPPFLRSSQRHRHCAFQPVHPLRKVEVSTASNEQMKVIGHHDKSANRHTKLVSSSADVGFECVMGCF